MLCCVVLCCVVFYYVLLYYVLLGFLIRVAQASSSTTTLKRSALRILLELAIFDGESIIESTLGLQGSLDAGGSLLDALLTSRQLDKVEVGYSTKSITDEAVEVAELIALFSYSLIGSISLVYSHAVMKIIASIPSSRASNMLECKYRFWLEIAMSNLSLNSNDSMMSTFDDRYATMIRELEANENSIFFQAPVVPFSSFANYSYSWVYMPFAVWVSS